VRRLLEVDYAQESSTLNTVSTTKRPSFIFWCFQNHPFVVFVVWKFWNFVVCEFTSMGCMCSVPAVKDSERKGCSVKSLSSGALSVKSMFRRKPSEKDCEIPPDPAIPIRDLFMLASETTQCYFKNSVDPVLLTAIIIIESSGDPRFRQWRSDFEEWAHGLGQMLYSTADYLFKMGYTAFDIQHEEDLYDSKVAMYFTCAYLDYLSKETDESNEEFLVKAYHKGPDCAQEASLELWDVYLKAASQILRLKSAMNCEDLDLQHIHIVQPGENLNIIARICSLAPEIIMRANPDIKEGTPWQTGDCIEIPIQRILPRLYAVKAGDNLDSIARRHDVSPLRLLRSNVDIKTPDCLRQGWVLSIPGLKGTSTEVSFKTDLISAGLEDGPFVFSQKPLECELEAEMNHRSFRRHCRSLSRDYIRQSRRSYKNVATSAIGKLLGVSKRKLHE